MDSLAVAALLLFLPALAIVRLFREHRATLTRLTLHGAGAGALSGVILVALVSLNRAFTLTLPAQVIVPMTTALLGGAVATAAGLLVNAFRRPSSTTTAPPNEPPA